MELKNFVRKLVLVSHLKSLHTLLFLFIVLFPACLQLPVSLDTDTAVVLGHGNVALDVARILLTPIDILAVCAAFCYNFSS